MSKNFKITAKEDNKEYWISRSMATRSEVVVVNNKNERFLVINKRGSGTPDFQGMWNIPCGYLEYDVTLKENATKELLEETGIYIPPFMWNFIRIEDDPIRSNKQNVTVVYRVVITEDKYKSQVQIGKEMNCAGGEENEVEDIKLLPLKLDNINDIEWAFNHKDIVKEIYYEGA